MPSQARQEKEELYQLEPARVYQATCEPGSRRRVVRHGPRIYLHLVNVTIIKINDNDVQLFKTMRHLDAKRLLRKGTPSVFFCHFMPLSGIYYFFAMPFFAIA